MENIEDRLKLIEERNGKVELDKAWETSIARRVLLAIFTYIVIGIFMMAIRVSSPWLNAIVPAIGFTISTLSMSLFKKIWIKYKK